MPTHTDIPVNAAAVQTYLWCRLGAAKMAAQAEQLWRAAHTHHDTAGGFCPPGTMPSLNAGRLACLPQQCLHHGRASAMAHAHKLSGVLARGRARRKHEKPPRGVWRRSRPRRARLLTNIGATSNA